MTRSYAGFWDAADEAALSAVWAPAAPGLTADRRLVQALAARGQTAHDVRHRVRTVQLVAGEVVGAITPQAGPGLLVYLGVTHDDGPEQVG